MSTTSKPVQVVEFVETKRDISLSYESDKFEFRSDKGWHWLQRLCFWALSKIGAFAIVKSITVSRHRVNSRSFIEAIHRQNAELIDLYHYRGERLLIGPEEWRKLRGEEINTQISMQLRYDWQDNVQVSVCGMNVTIVPWMTGILVVPKEWR